MQRNSIIRWFIFLLFVIPFVTQAQEIIEGVVVDVESGKPIPYASIGVEGTLQGTSSNMEGQFSLSVANSFSLRVTCVGYETAVVTSVAAAKRIELKPKYAELNAVLVTSKPIRPGTVVEKALGKISRNYSTDGFLQKFFYRHYCRDNGKYGRLIEAFVDVWKDHGYRSQRKTAGDDESIRVTQLRRSLDRTQMAQGHEPISIKSILETDLIGYQTEFPSNRVPFFDNVSPLKVEFDRYVFQLEGISAFDNEEVFEISYTRKDTVSNGMGGYRVRCLVEGTLFITTEKYAIVKREELRTYGEDSIRTATFYRKYQDFYYPYHLMIDGKSSTVENSVHQSHIDLMSVEIRNATTDKFTSTFPGQEELLNIPYDSTFWASNTLLKATPLEADIIHDLGGGVQLSRQFERYRQYHVNTHQGGVDGEKKFNWLLNDSKGDRMLYVAFWSDNLQAYRSELEQIKQLQKKYGDKVTFVMVSLDDDEIRWQQMVKQFNLSSDGIINYRFGTGAQTTTSLEVHRVPEFILIDREGNIVDHKAKRPTDPLLLHQLNEMIAQP